MKMKMVKIRGRIFPKGGADAVRPMDDPTPSPPSPPSVLMTRSRARLLRDNVNLLLSLCDFDSPLNGLLLHAHTLCILSYETNEASTREGLKVARADTPEQIGARIGEPDPSPELPAAAPVDRPLRRQYRQRPETPGSD